MFCGLLRSIVEWTKSSSCRLLLQVLAYHRIIPLWSGDIISVFPLCLFGWLLPPITHQFAQFANQFWDWRFWGKWTLGWFSCSLVLQCRSRGFQSSLLMSHQVEHMIWLDPPHFGFCQHLGFWLVLIVLIGGFWVFQQFSGPRNCGLLHYQVELFQPCTCF